MQSSEGLMHAYPKACVHTAMYMRCIRDTAIDKLNMLDTNPCVVVAFKAELQHIASMPKL